MSPPSAGPFEVQDPAVEIRGPTRPLRDWSRELAGKRMLVTGAAGFLGGRLLRRLADLGLDVTGTALFPEEARVLRERGFRAELLDLASDESWDALLEGVDVVFNIAGRFQETEDGESAYDAVNHRGALRLAETASRVGAGRFVHCGTVGVHGNVKEIPATEETPFNPMDHYQRTKLRGERAILERVGSLGARGMTITVVRPAMVYGPADRRLLKLFRMVTERRLVMIGSGETLAHLDYIEDQTESFLLAAVAPREAVHGEAFNIASDAPLTLNELVRLIAREANVPLRQWRVPKAPAWLAALACEGLSRPFGIKPPLSRRRLGFFMNNRAFDYTKAKRRLGYESRWSNEDGIRETIAWYRKAGWM